MIATVRLPVMWGRLLKGLWRMRFCKVYMFDRLSGVADAFELRKALKQFYGGKLMRNP